MHKSTFLGLSEAAPPIWRSSHYQGKNHKMLNWTIQFSLKHLFVIEWHIISILVVIICQLVKPENGMENGKSYIQEWGIIIQSPTENFPQRTSLPPSCHAPKYSYQHLHLLLNVKQFRFTCKFSSFGQKLSQKMTGLGKFYVHYLRKLQRILPLTTSLVLK